MAAFINPALREFVATFPTEVVCVQVLVRRTGAGWELRHVDDRDAAADTLRMVTLEELRQLAQFTAGGAFRPLKAAPNLVSGWQCLCASEAELGDALDQLYPGGIADWFAAQSDHPPVTDYPEFTARQTGMYRSTALLDSASAATTTRVCCAAEFCWKRRLWTVPGLPPDDAVEKSLVPCLEPCAVLLEFARRSQRNDREDQQVIKLTTSEIESLTDALEHLLMQMPTEVREADFANALNPRRLRLIIEKLARAASPAEPADEH